VVAAAIGLGFPSIEQLAEWANALIMVTLAPEQLNLETNTTQAGASAPSAPSAPGLPATTKAAKTQIEIEAKETRTRGTYLESDGSARHFLKFLRRGSCQYQRAAIRAEVLQSTGNGRKETP
jgi:hypothetical protein